MKGISSIILSSINFLNILCYNIDLVQGIRNGKIPGDGELTYQVSIFINGEYACGGAALNRGNVLSAASCVLDEEGYFLDVKFEVVAGVTNFNSNMRRIKVIYIYIKNNFRPSSRSSSSTRRSFPRTLEKGDVSVLKLAYDIPNEVYVTFVSLPGAQGTKNIIKYNQKLCDIAGFGRTEPYPYVSSSNLSNLPYRRNTAGSLTYIQTRVDKINTCQNHYPQFDDSHICTEAHGFNATGACLGDVGSPLVFENMAIGVLQIYTPNCDERNIPAVYTRTSSFISFIDNAKRGSYQSDMRLGVYTGTHVQEPGNPQASSSSPDLELRL